jgi:hypothetical protein
MTARRCATSQFEIITDMPVRSLITVPRDRFAAESNASLRVRGHAWSDHEPVEKVELSCDGVQSRKPAKFGPLPDRFAWPHKKALVDSQIFATLQLTALPYLFS